MDDSFTRVDSSLPLPEIVAHVAEQFQLGEKQSFSLISTGYQECNVNLTTDTGRFVIKIFSKEKSKERIEEVIWGYSYFRSRGVPFPPLRATKGGHRLLEISGNTSTLFVCVFPFFEGKPLTQTPVTDADMQSLAQALAIIHAAPKKINRYYDALGIVNAPEEYTLKKAALLPEENALIQPVIAKLRRIDLALLPQSIIHGSMEKENILKSASGEICLLDLGCMDYNASILDIATCIANITIYLDAARRSHVINTIIATYQQTRHLTPQERTVFPTLIRAQYAAYIIGMAYHMRKEHDMGKQTQTWLDRGRDGLLAYTKVRDTNIIAQIHD